PGGSGTLGDELAGREEPVGIADGGDERRGADQVHARDGHQPADLRPGQRLLGDQLLDRRDLSVEELDLADPGVDGLALLERQLQPASHSRPLTPNRSEHGGLPCSRRCRHAWVSFLTRLRECTSCSRRESRRRRMRQRSSGIHTASSSPLHKRLANARASSLSVFALALEIPVSSGETTTTRLTCGSRILATSQQLPVTSNATRSEASRLSASELTPSGVAGTRPAERTSPSPQIAT